MKENEYPFSGHMNADTEEKYIEWIRKINISWLFSEYENICERHVNNKQKRIDIVTQEVILRLSNSKSELLPCPFCGGIAVMMERALSEFPYCIYCDECEAQTPFCKSKGEVINRWNRRKHKIL